MFLFSVPHYEVVKIHSVRHTISKRSIKPSSDNARDTSNSKHYYARRSSTGRNADEDRQESTFDGKHEFSPYNDHFEKNYNISPSRNLGITDVRWNRINGSFYPSTNTLSSVPSNPPPQLSRTSYASSSSSKCTFLFQKLVQYCDREIIMLLEIINIQSIITFFQQTHLLHHQSC